MAKIKPTQKQLNFMDWEFGAFFHFGIRTFYPGHGDWDGNEHELTPDRFNPDDLNCEQWIKTVKEAGATYAIFTAKHHDGFANWPSKYTDYGVVSAPWKNGKGDVVREFVDACRKYDLKVGLYYSPADANAKNRTDEEHDLFFVNQISELLSNYGKIDYLWFDGCGSEGHEYDKPRIINCIRSLQPDILVFNMWDPDTRWIGDEAGIAPLPNYNTVSSVDFSVLTSEKDKLETEMFLPGECDFKMRTNTWFASEDDGDTAHTADELMGIYDYSVGRGANFLVNVGPDKTGHLAEPDASNLLEFGRNLKKRFAAPIAQSDGAVLKDNAVLLSADDFRPINCAVIQEDLTDGESVRRFELVAFPHCGCRGGLVVYSGYQIGHKAICSFPTIVTKDLVLRITEQNGGVKIRSVKTYCVK